MEDATMIKGPVTQTWTHSLTFMQQTVLLTAVRGPDGLPKYGPVKMLLRWYRRCILRSSLDDGVVLGTPLAEGGGSFMGRSIIPGEWSTWQAGMDDVVDDYMRDLDAIPHHFQLHLMHAFEIVGYKHPNEAVRLWFCRAYHRLVNDMHLNVETEEELDRRLGDDRSGWLAKADPATVD